MNRALRTLVLAGTASLAAAGLAATSAQALVPYTVTPAGYCSPDEGMGGAQFWVQNAEGLQYHLVAYADGVKVQDSAATVPNAGLWVAGPDSPFGTPVAATLSIGGNDYTFGPAVVFEDDGCDSRPAVHDIHATVDFLCIEGDPTINLTVDNDGDYTEPMSGMFVDESFDTELGAGMSTNGQKVVAAGGHYEYSVMSGQTTLADDEGTMPDVCETGDDEASSGGLPETGSSQTLLALLAGLLLALGAGLVRFTTRPELVWAEGSDDTDLV